MTLAKLQGATFYKIDKIDEDKRIVYGVATTEQPDSQGGEWEGKHYDGDIVTSKAVESALPDYLKWSNVRAMHNDEAIGTVIKVEMKDKRLHVVVKVVDEGAWTKVKEKVYKGFSIGGNVVRAYLKKIGDKLYRIITKLNLTEISLVDRPANPEAKFVLWKGENTTMSKVTKTSPLAKQADPNKVIAMLQELRNAAELGGDLNTAQFYTEGIGLVLAATGMADDGEEAVAEEAPVEEEIPSEEEIAMAEDEAAAEEEVPAEEEEEEFAMAEDPAEEEEPKEAAEGSEEDDKDKEAAESSEEEEEKKNARPKVTKRQAAYMHETIKSLALRLASAGDPIGRKVASNFATKKVSATTLRKGDSDLLKGVSTSLTKLETTLSDIDERLQAIEAQPVPGGPYLRINKALGPAARITGQQLLAQPDPATTNGDMSRLANNERILMLQRQVALEPNPIVKKGYQAELASLLEK